MEQFKKKEKIHGSGSGTTTLIISNDEMDDIIKIVQALENQGILVSGVTKTIKNDIENQSGNGIGMILGTLGASLVGNLLSGRGLYRSGHGITRSGHRITRSGHAITRSGNGNKEEIKKSSNATTSCNKY